MWVMIIYGDQGSLIPVNQGLRLDGACQSSDKEWHEVGVLRAQ
jgi:hypothetical protein